MHLINGWGFVGSNFHQGRVCVLLLGYFCDWLTRENSVMVESESNF